MKTYCVKERKKTECIPNSEEYKRAKNGRLMLRCKCKNCGITKTRFVKEIAGKGVLDIPLKVAGLAETITKKVIPSTNPVFDRFWSGDLLKSSFGSDHGITSKKFWTHPDDKANTNPDCSTMKYDKKKKKYVMGYCD